MSKANQKAPELRTAEALRLWKAILRDYSLDEAGVELLRTCVMSYDNFLKFQEILMRSGPVYTTKDKLIKRNPIVDLIRTERAGFLQSLKDLGLESEGEEKRRPGRPSVRYGL